MDTKELQGRKYPEIHGYEFHDMEAGKVSTPNLNINQFNKFKLILSFTSFLSHSFSSILSHRFFQHNFSHQNRFSDI